MTRLNLSSNCFTGDLNADGKTDYWCQTGDQSSSWHVAISTGDGWYRPFWSGPAPGSMADTCLSGDLNGDGRTDFWCQTSNNSGLMHVALSTGSGWAMSARGGVTRPELSRYCLLGDLNGDGKTDYWCQTGNPGDWHTAQSTGATNLLTGITSATGMRISVSYEINTRAGSASCLGCSGPGIADTSARYLVTSTTTFSNRDLSDSGRVDRSETRYTYHNGRFSTGTIIERAALGFESMTTTDVNSGNYAITTFRQDKPFHGAAVVTRSYLANGTLLSEQLPAQPQQYLCDQTGCTEDTSNSHNPGLPRQIRFSGESETKSFENGNLISRKFEQVLSQDTFGNPLVVKTGIDAANKLRVTYKHTKFINDTSNYVIGFPYAEKVCFTDTECSEGTDDSISANRFFFDGMALGQSGPKRLMTKKENYMATDAGGGWVAETYQYDARGHIIDTTNAQGIRSEIVYDADYRQFPVTVMKSHGGKTRLSTALYDHRFGKARYTTEADSGTMEETSFDADGFVRKVETRNGTEILSRKSYDHSAYGAQPAWSEECTHFGTGFTQKKCTRKFADALGRTYRTEYPEFVNGVEQRMAVEVRYDARGRELKTSEPFPSIHSGCAGTPGAGPNPFTCKWNVKTYDDMNRVTRVTRWNNRHADSIYETAGLPTGIVSRVTETGEDGQRKITDTNVYGKPSVVREAIQTANQYTTVIYTYDDRGRMTKVTAPQGVTEIGYVPVSDLQLFIDDQNVGPTNYEYFLTPSQPSYGKLRKETRNGYVTSFEYNAAFGRLSRTIKASVAAPTVALETLGYIYDQTDKPFGNGRLTTLTQTKDGFTIQERYSYDARGEVTETVRRVSHATETLCADADAMPCLQTFGKTKDSLGRVTDMLYPDGKHSTVEYMDNFSAHVFKIKHNGATYATYSDYTHDITTHIGKITYGNGVEHRYTYNPDTGLLNTFNINSATAVPLIDINYEYNNSYNIYRINDRVIADLSIAFDYDAHKRIRTATLDSGKVREYRFDLDGQKDSKGNLELKGNRRMTYGSKTYPVSDEVFDDNANAWKPNQAFTWSASGYLTTKGPFTFTYDSNGMMTRAVETQSTSVTTVAGDTKFFYDHTGQRFLKTHTRAGVMIKTWYLGDGIEYREKYIGTTFDAYQATKYIYGVDDKKLASITGNVQTTQPTATSSNLFALADSYSSTSLTGVAKKTYYTFYGIYAHDAFGKATRIATLSLAAFLLLIYLVFGQRGESTFPVWMRLTAATMLLSFVSVNCGTGNAPGTTPTDLSGPGPGAIGTPGGANTAAQPTNTFISALYTGLPVGTVYYSHNHLGSGALVTDSAGNEVFRITYTEYGEIDLANSGKYNPATGEIEHHLSDALIAITAVKYTGQEYDPETGFYYYNARYYDPQLGIFTTPDKKFDRKAGSFAFNRHMYVAGNPIMYNDPSGHFIETLIAIGIGALVGAGVGAGSSIIAQAAANNWNFKAIDWGKVGEGAAFGAIAGAVTGGTGYFLNSKATVAALGKSFGVSNAAILQTAINGGSINMISMYGAGERDAGKLFGYFGAGFAASAATAGMTAKMGHTLKQGGFSMGKRMLARYSVQALSTLTKSAFNTMVDSKNNLGFSVWGANFSFTKDGLRVSPSIPFAVSQGVVLTGGGTIDFDVETLSLTLDESIISDIQGKDWGGLSIYSVLRSNSGTKDSSLAHEIEHVWQSRFAGDDWGAQYLLGLSNGHGYLGTNGFYCGNFYESQAYTVQGRCH